MNLIYGMQGTETLGLYTACYPYTSFINPKCRTAERENAPLQRMRGAGEVVVRA
jgi:hypothetical protein